MFSNAAGAVPAPHLTWRSLESQWCEIHFHLEVEAQARRVSVLCDEAVRLNAALLDSFPTEKIEMIVSDTTDFENGYAITVPYNRINVFTVGPSSDSQLGHTEDSLELLVAHEVFHIVHLEISSGLPSFVNRVLGKVWPPNQIVPTWVVEGMAVYAESRVTTAGRVRSSLLDARLRLSAVEGDLWGLEDLSNVSRRQPGGSAPYLYGGRFFAYLVAHHGEDVLSRFAHDYGGRLIPYALQRSFSVAKQIDLDVEYEAFLASLREDAARVRAKIVARGGPTQRRQLTHLGRSADRPRFDRKGQLFFAALPAVGRAGLFTVGDIREPTAPVATPLLRLHDSVTVAPLGGDRFLVGQPNRYWNNYAFYDLAIVEADRPIRWVTRGKRLQDPDVFPDRKRAVAAERTGNGSAIVIVDLETGATKDLVRYRGVNWAYTPRVSPDGTKVVFSLLEQGGARDIVVVDVETGEASKLTNDNAEDHDPTFTPNGGAVVFSSDREGVFNIYALHLESNVVTRVTDTLGAATAPEISPDGRAVVYMDLSLNGRELFVSAMPTLLTTTSTASSATPRQTPRATHSPPLSFPTPFPFAELPTARSPSLVAPPVHDLGPQLAPVPGPALHPPTSTATNESESTFYNPLPTLLPKTWLPLVSQDAAGGSAVGVQLAGNDAIDAHSWALEATWGFGLMRPRVSGSWRFRDLFFPVTLSGEWRTVLSDAERRNEGQPELQQETRLRSAIEVSLPIGRWWRSHSFGVGYSRSFVFVETPVTAPPDGLQPNYPAPSDIGSLTLRWSYTSTERYRDSVVTEDGESFTLRTRVANEWTLSPINLYEVTADARVYRRIPGLVGHVIALLPSVGWAKGDRRRRANYRLGGFSDRDLTADIVNQTRFSTGFLRGYGANSDVGDAYWLVSTEYHFPLAEIEFGVSSLPIALTRLSGAVFADAGDAFDALPRPAAVKIGVGAEVRLQMRFGYFGVVVARLGYARGLSPGGEHQPYLILGSPY